MHWLILDLIKILFARVLPTSISQIEAFLVYFLLVSFSFAGSVFFYHIIKKRNVLLMLLAGGR